MHALLAPIRPELWAIIFFSTVINALVLVVPLYTMHLYDKVLPSHSLPTLVSLTLAAAALVSGMGILDGLRARVQIRAGGEVNNALSNRVFDVVMARLVRAPAAAPYRLSPTFGSCAPFSPVRGYRLSWTLHGRCCS